MSTAPIIFNHTLKNQQRQRAQLPQVDYLHQHSANHIAEILQEDVLSSFSSGAEILSNNNYLYNKLKATDKVKNTRQISHNSSNENLELTAESFDLITSSLALHWINDLPGILVQCRLALQEKGLFLATMLGGNSLFELRDIIQQVEAEIYGGISPRISPMVDVKDAGMLLQRTGFYLPVTSSETINVRYASAINLMQDLKQMGEQNALSQRKSGLMTPKFLQKIIEKYAQKYSDNDGKINATFEIITLTGWKS